MTVEFWQEHKLAGLYYSRQKNQWPADWQDIGAFEFQKQFLHNELILNEVVRVENLARENHLAAPTRLKGTALIHRLYQNLGERHLTDIDLLVQECEFQKYISLLEQDGYSQIKQIVWSANLFKVTLFKEDAIGFTYYIDLHDQLFWSQHKNYEPHVVNRNGFYELDDPDLLLHLVVNWSFQDNFISLNKLMDIEFLIRKYPHLPQSTQFKSLIEINGMKNSWQLVKLALNRQFTNFENSDKSRQKNEVDNIRDDSTQFSFLSKFQRMLFNILLNDNFLKHPRQFKVRYFLLKHFSKKNIWQAIVYDWLWIKAYGMSLIFSGYFFLKIQAKFRLG